MKTSTAKPNGSTLLRPTPTRGHDHDPVPITAHPPVLTTRYPKSHLNNEPSGSGTVKFNIVKTKQSPLPDTILSQPIPPPIVRTRLSRIRFHIIHSLPRLLNGSFPRMLATRLCIRPSTRTAHVLLFIRFTVLMTIT